jgi:hypothetical protein
MIVLLAAWKNAFDVGMELIDRINLTKKNYYHIEETLSDLRAVGIDPADAIIHIDSEPNADVNDSAIAIRVLSGTAA